MPHYRRARCVTFNKVDEPFGAFSNMAGGYDIKVNDKWIRTSEALYQSMRYPHQPDWQKEILDAKSPMEAKMKSKKEGRRKNGSRADWGVVSVDIMRWCLAVKLAWNHDRFSRLLLETDGRDIVEDSTARKDTFWGARETAPGILEGENTLGILLMELRDKLRQDPDPCRHRIVEPLSIPDFLLLTEPIRAVIAPKRV